MKKELIVILGTLILFLSASFTEVAYAAQEQVLTFESNIKLSSGVTEPSLNDSVQTIILNFNEEIDATTILDSIKLYKVENTGKLIEEKCMVKLNSNNPKSININNIAITKLKEGEVYQLTIDKSLKSKTGSTLKDSYIGYFATNNNFSFQGASDLKNERSQIIVISDFHLGVDDAFSEVSENKDALAEFLNMTKAAPNVAELVIAGDMFDEWFLPINYQMPNSLSDFHDKIVKNNKEVVDAINKIITEGKIKVTYISGNHDLLLSEKEVARIFPGIKQVREEVQGLGTYIAGNESEIAIEHGHRYNFFCAPDMFSNRNITKNNTSILPAGYFFTRIATTSVIEGHPKTNNTFEKFIPNMENKEQLNYYYYYQIWKSLLTNLPITESFADKVIKTNIDGFTENYSVNDLIPRQNADGSVDLKLYKESISNWEKRQVKNRVNSIISTKDAIIGSASASFTDLQSKKQYFDIYNSKRIVVFGHTHEAKILSFRNLNNEKTIYANSGTWIDMTKNTSYPTKTFVVITKPTSKSAIETVNLYQYLDDKTIVQWEDGQAITNIPSTK